MINKNRFGVANDKKLLRKIGKQWVTVSALTLTLLGGGLIASSVITHADVITPTVEANDTNSVKKQLNSNLDKAYQASQSASASSQTNRTSAASSQSSSANKLSSVQSKADDMHDALLQNAAVKSSQNSSYKSTHKYSLTNTKSNVASNGSVSSSSPAKPSFNPAYQSYMAQMGGVDSEVASTNDSNAQSNNENIKEPLLKDNAQPDYFSGNVTKTGTDDGLNYKVYQNGGVEVTGGTAQNDLSDFSNTYSNKNATDMNDAKAIKFDNAVDTSNVTNMNNMFIKDISLHYLTLPSSFDTSKVTDMSNMFYNDNSLQLLTLPSSFDTSKVTDMGGMFMGDNSLQSLTLPSSFDTSNVTSMSDMFGGDRNLQSLTLPNSFNTSNVTDMSEMFYNNESLQALTIQSPNTKINNDSALQPMYKTNGVKDLTGRPYTASEPNDFSDGNMGTFLSPAHIPTDTINYQYNGATKGSQQFKASPSDYVAGKYIISDSYKDLDVTPSNAKLPNGYHLVNADNQYLFDNGIYDVAIAPNAVTINYQYNGATKGEQQFKATDSDYSGLDVTPSNAQLPNGYHLVNSDNNVKFDNGTYNVKITPNAMTTTVDYQYNGATKGSQTFTATDYSDLDVTKSNAQLPNGYHLVNNDNNVKFDNGTYNIAIMPNAMTTTVEYQYNGSNVSKQTFMANLSDYNVNVNKYNDIDITSSDNIPNGYHLIRANNKIPFDNGTHDVEIAPNVVTVDYQYDGATKGSQTFKATDNDYSSLDITSTNAQLPNGYHLVNNDNNVKFDNGTYNIAIMPNTMTTTVDYQYNGATKGSQTFTANLSDYNVNVNRYNDMDITSSDSIPKWYHLVNANNRVPFDNGTHDVAIAPNSVNVQYHDIYGDSDGLTPPASAVPVSSDGTYTVTAPQGWALVSPDGFTKTPSASGYVSKNVTVDVAPYTNGLTFDYDKNDNTLEFVHRVPSEDDSPYHISDIKNVGSITFGSDAYMNNKAVNIDPVFAQDNNLRKVTIKSNKTKVSAAGPFYDSIFANDSSFPLRPIQQIISINKATINRAYDSQGYLNRNNMYDKKYKVKSGAEIYATTPSKTINPLKKINGSDNVSVYGYPRYMGILQGRSKIFLPMQRKQIPKRLIPKQVPNTAKLIGEAFIRYPFQDVRVCYVIKSNYGHLLCVQHDLNVQSPSLFSAGLPFPSLYKEMANGDTAPVSNNFAQGNVGTFVRHMATVNYVSNKDGKSVGSCSITGDSSSIQGASDTSVDITPMTAQNLPKGYHLVNTHNQVPFDGQAHNVMVSGDMVVGTAYLTLLYQKNNRTNGRVLKLHINGNIGDSPITINPQDYDKPGYQVSTSRDWSIPFDYSTVNSISHGDFSRYNRENTFIYQAYPTKIQIEYIDTQTHNPVPNTQVQTFDNIAYDGDTVNLEDSNASNGVVSVDDNNYRLNLPDGYHLAHTNNYIKVTANGTYTKQVSNGVGGFRSVRMPLMKLTLGITPHFNKHTTKPASSSSVTPVKPSSASPVRPSSTSSVAPSNASQSVAPSSTASITPIVLPSSEASSTSKPSSVAQTSSSAKSASASESPAPSVVKKPVVKPTIHKAINPKSTAKHNEARLNHSISKATKQLNTVERHMKARKATHAKRVIKHAKKRLHYLRHNKRHVAHALRRITRNKVAIKHAKRVVRTAKQVVYAKAASVGPTTDKSTAPSVKASVTTPRAKSTAIHTNRKKLPQTSEATDHAGIVAIILMIMSVILAGFDKAFGREHN